MTITQTLTSPPTAPNRDTMTKPEFDAAVDLRLAWDATNVTETTALVAEINTFEIAGTLSEVQGTSASSNSIGTGTKTFTVLAGKSWVVGMTLAIVDTASPDTNYMIGAVTDYSATTLIVNVTTTGGSGTITAWTIFQAGAATTINVPGGTLGTPVAATSGTSITFTGIPAGTKMIQVNFNAASTNGTSAKIIQLGDSGGVENSGYVSPSVAITSGAAVTASSDTTGFLILSTGAGDEVSGIVTLTLESASTFTWVCSGIITNGGGTTILTTGRKALSAELTQVRVTTVTGVQTFDNGEINILYM